MNYIKKNKANIVLIFIFFTGLCLLLYPTVSNYINSLHQSKGIVLYSESVSNIDDETYKRLLDEANAYNADLATTGMKWQMSDDDLKEYENLLKISDNGIMGYIEIPSIDCKLAIYHGTSESVLSTGVGHLEGTSLPVGGESTHTVISGHRGLPSAKLFSRLDKLAEGDLFTINVLDETLTYEVDQIRIVEPENLSALAIEEGKDYCTLVTCTPYGVNTHRLLVRGHRVENITSTVRVTADARELDRLVVSSVLAIPFLLILLIFLLVRTRSTNTRKSLKRMR